MSSFAFIDIDLIVVAFFTFFLQNFGALIFNNFFVFYVLKKITPLWNFTEIFCVKFVHFCIFVFYTKIDKLSLH